MNCTIEALGPQNALDYLTYLEKMDFHHAPDWAGCFCRYYHNDCSDAQWKKRSAKENQEEALKAIRQGTMKGYLAYDHDKVIGWINANHVDAYPRLTAFIQPYIVDKKVACVVCFVIHPQYRHQGVASQLLNHAVNDFFESGYDAVLGFPFEIPQAPQKAYRGFTKMYLDLGFKIIDQKDQVTILRKGFDPCSID